MDDICKVHNNGYVMFAQNCHFGAYKLNYSAEIPGTLLRASLEGVNQTYIHS
jgi:hypothetical protein